MRGRSARLLASCTLIVWTATLALGGVAGAQTITTFAGGGAVYGDGGPATSAQLTAPMGIAVDAGGNVYVADPGAVVVRRIDGATGMISTAAGINGVEGFCIFVDCGDGGPAALALLAVPFDVAVDTSGNVYIADQGNGRIRKVDVATGIMTTVAGTGVGLGGDGGLATAAALGLPEGVATAAATSTSATPSP